jgi:hypothetical protein
LNDPEKFIALIITYKHHQTTVVSNMMYHFKVYLTKKLYFYSKDEEREEMLSEAMHFFNTKLTFLVWKLGGVNDVQFKAMPRNFLFYQKCIDKKNIKSILTSEFSSLKLALKSGIKTEIAIPAENLAFLAGPLNGIDHLSLVCN